MGLIKSNNAPASLSAFSMADIEHAAKRMLLRAQQQAEQLLTEAQVEADAMRKAGHAEGLTAGKREGLAAGLDEGKKAGHAAAIAEHREKLTALIGTLSAGLHAIDDNRRAIEADGITDVVRLTMAIAARITRRQGAVDPQVLAANIADALKLVVHAADIRIVVHPSQIELLQAMLPELQAAWPNLKHIDFAGNPGIAPGGCKLATAGGLVDADLNTQLDRIAAELLPGDALAGIAPPADTAIAGAA